MSEWLQFEAAPILKYLRVKWLRLRDCLAYLLTGYRVSDLLSKIRSLRILLEIAQAGNRASRKSRSQPHAG